MPHSRDLAAALSEERAVRPEVLERARREQRRSGRPLWAVVLESGLCTDDAVFLALRRWSGAPALPEERLLGLRVPPELQAAVPRELARAEGVLPLERSPDGRRAALAMVDPLSEAAGVCTALQRSGIVEIHRFLVHRAVLQRCLDRLYGVPIHEQPTGIVRLPAEERPQARRRVRNDETEQIVGRGGRGQRGPLISPPAGSVGAYGTDDRRRGQRGPLISPPAVPRRHAAITRPLPQIPPAVPGTVQIAPDLMAEIERLESGGTPTGPLHAVPQSAEATVLRGEPALAEAARALVLALEQRLRPGAPRLLSLAHSVEKAAAAEGLPRSADIGLLFLLRGAARLLGESGEGQPLAHAQSVLMAGALTPKQHERARRLLEDALGALEEDTPARRSPWTSGERPGGELPRAVEHRAPLPGDEDPTREVPMPEASEAGADAGTEVPAEPQEIVIEIEPADLSDAGLEAYYHEEK